MEWVDLVLEEYKSLRQESLAAIDRQQRVLASGTATAGVVLGLGVNASPGSTLAAVLLVGLGPLLALLITVMWLGEVERMVRAGAYVSRLESRINRNLVEAALEWESWLRREAPGGRRILWVYRAVFGILWLIAFAGASIGVIGMARHGWLAQLGCGLGDALLLGSLLAFYGASEYRMRGIGGKRWDPDAVPRILRWLIGDPSAGFRDDETAVDLPARRAPRD
jgi:hypothetical protein